MIAEFTNAGVHYSLLVTGTSLRELAEAALKIAPDTSLWSTAQKRRALGSRFDDPQKRRGASNRHHYRRRKPRANKSNS